MPSLFELYSSGKLVSIEWDPNKSWSKELSKKSKEHYAGENTAFANEMFIFRQMFAVSTALEESGFGAMSTADYQIELQRIYNDYISDDAPNQINIKAETREKLDELMQKFTGNPEKDAKLVTQVLLHLKKAEAEVKALLASDVMPRVFKKELEAQHKLRELKTEIESRAKNSDYKFNNPFGGTKIKLEDGTRVRVPDRIARIYNEINKNYHKDPVQALEKVGKILAGKSLESIKGDDKTAQHDTYSALKDKFMGIKSQKSETPTVDVDNNPTPPTRSRP